jgi:adenylate cyclase class IV
MPRNIEIKARNECVAAIEPRAAAIATEGPIEIAQDDTFFRCADGRLKLRDIVEWCRPVRRGSIAGFSRNAALMSTAVVGL